MKQKTRREKKYAELTVGYNHCNWEMMLKPFILLMGLCFM